MTIRIHMVYGLSSPRQRFINILNRDGIPNISRTDDIFLYIDNLVLADQEVINRDRKLAIMKDITRRWALERGFNDAQHLKVMQWLQANLEVKLREISQGYAPTSNVSEWERRMTILKGKRHDFFSRKCKIGLTITGESPVIPEIGDSFLLHQPFFVLNGLNYLNIITKHAATRSLITFRELRAAYRNQTRNVAGHRPLFIEIVNTSTGEVVRPAPAPWDDDRTVDITIADARAFGVSNVISGSSAIDESIPGIYKVRLNEIWGHVYKVGGGKKPKHTVAELMAIQ